MKKIFNALLIYSFISIVGCSGSSKTESDGGGSRTFVVTTDLIGAVNPVMDTAPVVITTLKRQDGTSTSIDDADVGYEYAQSISGVIAEDFPAGYSNVGSQGVASLALPAGNYKRVISGFPMFDLSNTGGGGRSTTRALRYDITVSNDTTQTTAFKADEQAWAITSDVDLESVTIRIYQSVASGNLIQSSNSSNRIQPVLDTTINMLAGSPQDITVNTELLEGIYIVTIAGTPIDPNNKIATYKSAVFTVAGTQQSSTNSVSLSATGKAVTLILKDTAGDPLDGWTIRGYDTNSSIKLGSAKTNVDGNASLLVNESFFTDVWIEIFDGFVRKGYFRFPNIAINKTKSLKLYEISGAIVATAGSTLGSMNGATVKASPNAGLGDFIGSGISFAETDIEDTGIYTITLFGTTTGLLYMLTAEDVPSYPDVTDVSVNVINSNTSIQNIEVNVGGVILGRIENEANKNIQDIFVGVYKAGTDTLVNRSFTDNNGNYSIQVPYGTYDIWADGEVKEGAATRNITVSAASPTFTHNLTQYQITGRVTDTLGGGVGANIHISGEGGDKTASNLGVYTINVMEGENFFCFTPPANKATLGYTCTFNVIVNDTTVATAQSKANSAVQ